MTGLLQLSCPIALLGCLALGLSTSAKSQGSIYTCVDTQGRRLTSDRPIPECLNRAQKELNPSGTVKRHVGPALSAEERLKKEEAERIAEEERVRRADERKRDLALLVRYPNQLAHDKERALAIDKVDEVIKTAKLRLEDLAVQRQRMVAEEAQYKKDPTKTPGALKRQLEENSLQSAAQHRFISDKENEKKRVHLRFDEELNQLRRLWALPGQNSGQK